MIRANDILEMVVKVLRDKPSLTAIDRIFQTCNAEFVRFGSLFRVAENDTRQPLDTLLKNIGVQHQRVAGNALSRDQKKQLWDLYESNYANDSEKEPLLALIHEELQHNYQDPRAQFHFFMHNSHMLLTAKFVEQADGSVYF